MDAALLGACGQRLRLSSGSLGFECGFYGGVDYGHGYVGNGYTGGHWMGQSFAYNSSVNHVTAAVAQHVYAEPLPNSGSRRWSSSVGGPPKGAAAHPAAHHAPPPTLDKLATTSQVERNREPTSSPVEINKPAAGIGRPPAVSPDKIKRVTPSRAVPIKP